MSLEIEKKQVIINDKVGKTTFSIDQKISGHWVSGISNLYLEDMEELFDQLKKLLNK